MKREIEVGDVIQFRKDRPILWNTDGEMDKYLGTWHIITPDMLALHKTRIVIENWWFSIKDDIVSHFKVGDIVSGWFSYDDDYSNKNWEIAEVYIGTSNHVYAKPLHYGRARYNCSCNLKHVTLITPVEQKNKETIMETGTDFKAGEYVVLLSSCNGRNVWADSIPENYVYQLRDNSSKGVFNICCDIKGSNKNGWTSIPTLVHTSKLLLRHATSKEIMEYIEAGNKPVPCHDKVTDNICKETNIQTITKENLGKIHTVACSKWKEIIKGYAEVDPFASTVTLTNEQVKTMFKESNSDQTEVLIEAGLVKPYDPSVNIKSFNPITDKDDNRLIERRVSGEFASHAFYLNEKFDWKIVIDNQGKHCLVPTKNK